MQSVSFLMKISPKLKVPPGPDSWLQDPFLESLFSYYTLKENQSFWALVPPRPDSWIQHPFLESLFSYYTLKENLGFQAPGPPGPDSWIQHPFRVSPLLIT